MHIPIVGNGFLEDAENYYGIFVELFMQ